MRHIPTKPFSVISLSPNKTERAELSANGYSVYCYIGGSMAEDLGIEEKEARMRCEGVRLLYMRASKKNLMNPACQAKRMERRKQNRAPGWSGAALQSGRVIDFSLCPHLYAGIKV
ncbi:hypothetical protein [Chlorobaculum sp. 24CR]|uniref:hypothetical protein n=1 Tax=Chlorobaculum sp. 24CR TaxID=2508878 RepID=UPI00142FA31B|nr:hypothetical protein [Chlorobaculum sp. 24CR]